MPADYSIANFDFVALSAPPEYPFAQVGIETHAGIDGFAVWLSGNRGREFQLQSLVDVPGSTPAQAAAAAAQLIRLYRGLIFAGGVDMVWAGFPVAGVEFVVLRVDPVACHGVLLGRGGTLGSSLGVCRANWTLVPREPLP